MRLGTLNADTDTDTHKHLHTHTHTLGRSWMGRIEHVGNVFSIRRPPAPSTWCILYRLGHAIVNIPVTLQGQTDANPPGYENRMLHKKRKEKVRCWATRVSKIKRRRMLQSKHMFLLFCSFRPSVCLSAFPLSLSLSLSLFSISAGQQIDAGRWSARV